MVQVKRVLVEQLFQWGNSTCREICGYLLGSESQIIELYPMTNVASMPTRQFEFDPIEQFTALRYAREQGYELIGVYHSHPNGVAEPSQHDIDHADPDLVYMIIVPETSCFELFRIDQCGITVISHKYKIV